MEYLYIISVIVYLSGMLLVGSIISSAIEAVDSNVLGLIIGVLMIALWPLTLIGFQYYYKRAER